MVSAVVLGVLGLIVVDATRRDVAAHKAALQRATKAAASISMWGVFALVPVAVAAGAAFFAAATWTLWFALGASCMLLIWWSAVTSVIR